MPLSPSQLKNIRLLQGLAETELALIASRLQKCVFLSNRVILSREEVADALYFIIDGKVRVELKGPAGQIYNIAEAGPGEYFGERAILTGEPRTADVRAITEVTAARLLRGDFEKLLSATPLLYANLCRHLAMQLGSWAQRYQREEREHREVMANVIGWQLLPEFEAFPGSSPWVRALNGRLQMLGVSAAHLLIVGEAGTWKDLAARLVHFHGNPGRPVLFLDCSAPPPVEGQPPSGKQPVQNALYLEIAQDAALFGHGPNGAVYARRVRRGMLELAAGGDMILRNIDCLAPAVQENLLAFLDQGRFSRRGENEIRNSVVRIIATCGEPLEQMVAAGRFSRPLFERLGEETVVMSPLRERKRDIPVIARSLLPALNAKHHKNVRRLSQNALNRLVEYDWPLNGTELYQVLSRGVVVCDGDELLSEQIFLQGQSLSGGGRFNLLQLPALEKLARRSNFPRRLNKTTVPLFLAVLLGTLFGPVADNAANLAVWTLWWPALLLTGFLFARGWCSYCPLEAISKYLMASRNQAGESSRLVRKWGPVASLVLFLLILLVEQATGMFSHAFATGLLLLTLLLSTLLGDIFLGRRGWCKYLCPLGRIVSMLSRVSLVEMHSNHEVCVSRCRVDECVKEKGCPMGLHPTGIDNSDHCVLCLDCVRNCPHSSMQLDLRNPFWGLFKQNRRGFAEALFSVSLAGIIIAAKGLPIINGRQAEVFPKAVWGGEEVASALAIVLSFAALAMLISIDWRRYRWRAAFAICGSAYLPLALAGLFILYFRAFVEAGSGLVPLTLAAVGLDQWLDLRQLTPDLATLGLLIRPLIVAAGAWSWFALGSLHRQYNLGMVSHWGHRLLVIVVTVAFVCLL